MKLKSAVASATLAAALVGSQGNSATPTLPAQTMYCPAIATVTIISANCPSCQVGGSSDLGDGIACDPCDGGEYLVWNNCSGTINAAEAGMITVECDSDFEKRFTCPGETLASVVVRLDCGDCQAVPVPQ